jgi:peptidyl-tRNA hydrolase, PTH1 family
MDDTGGIKMVVGLGNPGREYANTRHNAGFKVIDLLSEALNIEVKKKRFGAVFGEGNFAGKKLILLKPWLFMNRSGQAVATAAGFYKLPLSDLIVVLDDLALPPGKIRLRANGSAGGHNGLADIIAKLGSDNFARLRVGIGQSEFIDQVDYVLGRPSKEDAVLMDEASVKAKEAVLFWIENGIETAMNKFN